MTIESFRTAAHLRRRTAESSALRGSPHRPANAVVGLIWAVLFEAAALDAGWLTKILVHVLFRRAVHF